jgi:putative hydrolase of the HAD superfamily
VIVLDLDDTLYLERNYVRSGFQAVDHWLKIYRSFEGFFDEAWSLFESGARGTIFNMVLEGRGLRDANLVKDLINVYRSHMPLISLESDAVEFLCSYRLEELALITDGPAISQWAKIKALNIEKYIGTIIVTSDLGSNYSKPNPASFERIQGTLDGNECVYIADNPLKDFIAPASLGWMSSIRIRRTGSLHYYVSTPDNCVEAISLSDVDPSLLEPCKARLVI